MTKVETNASLLERRNRAVPRGPFNVAPLFVTRAEGSRLWDADGNEYIDFCGGIGVMNVGHGHPAVLRAVEAQARNFMHTSWHVTMYESYVRLAERLNELVPVHGDTMSCFFNSGAEAVENGVKIARYHTGRTGVVCFERGFHGRTLLGMTLTGKVMPYSAGFGPFAPEVYRLPCEPFFGAPERSDEQAAAECRVALDHLLSYHVAPEAIACILLEPVLGEGGFLPLHPGAAGELRSTADRHGFLIVADEVQAGFGRTGRMFASEHYALDPDLVLMAKSLAAGMPLSAVSGRAEIMDAPHAGGLGGTYGGNPVACAAANAVLDIMRDEELPARAMKVGAQVVQTFEALVRDCPTAGGVSGLGAMCGLHIVDPDSGAPDTARAQQIVARCLEGGLLIMTASGNVLRTLMPLNIPDDQLCQALEVLDGAVRATTGTPEST